MAARELNPGEIVVTFEFKADEATAQRVIARLQDVVSGPVTLRESSDPSPWAHLPRAARRAIAASSVPLRDWDPVRDARVITNRVVATFAPRRQIGERRQRSTRTARRSVRRASCKARSPGRPGSDDPDPEPVGRLAPAVAQRLDGVDFSQLSRGSARGCA